MDIVQTLIKNFYKKGGIETMQKTISDTIEDCLLSKQKQSLEIIKENFCSDVGCFVNPYTFVFKNGIRNDLVSIEDTIRRFDIDFKKRKIFIGFDGSLKQPGKNYVVNADEWNFFLETDMFFEGSLFSLSRNLIMNMETDILKKYLFPNLLKENTTKKHSRYEKTVTVLPI